MERTINVSGKQIKIKSTAATPIRYRSEFGVDFFKDVMYLGTFGNKINERQNKDETAELTLEDVESVNLEVIYQLLWIFAKEANPNIEPYVDWLANFDNLPLDQIGREISPLIVSMMQSKKKPFKKKNGKQTKKK